MANEKNCFVIMPISTPENMMPEYRDGKDHFLHVLDCLILPSIKKAGFEAIPPKAKGTDLIQAEIVNNLEKSELVLCDISTLNPNVFYEFGTRTSLNKPICVIKDNLTKKVPFDTAVLNYYEYDSAIEPWILEGEIENLSKHINETFKRSNGTNDMWKYFGFKSEAIYASGEFSQESQSQIILNMIENLAAKVDDIYESNMRREPKLDWASEIRQKNLDDNKRNSLKNFIKLMRFDDDIRVTDVDIDSIGNVTVYLNKNVPTKLLPQISGEISGISSDIRSISYVTTPKIKIKD